MRRSIFKAFLPLALVAVNFSTAHEASAVEVAAISHTEDSVGIAAAPAASVTTSRYDNRVHHYRDAWGALIPTHIKIQYAGGMGMLSAGIGWDYGKRGQWETDLLFGFIAKHSSRRAKMTMTLKQNFIPWSISLGKGFSLEPLSTGLYFNTVFGGEFWSRQPERYPSGYYTFSTRIRTHIFIGQRWRCDIPASRRFFFKSISVFYELSSSDFYIITAIRNRSQSPSDYLRLSFGLKFDIF